MGFFHSGEIFVEVEDSPCRSWKLYICYKRIWHLMLMYDVAGARSTTVALLKSGELCPKRNPWLRDCPHRWIDIVTVSDLSYNMFKLVVIVAKFHIRHLLYAARMAGVNSKPSPIAAWMHWNHGSVQNGCISNRIVTSQMSHRFPLNHDSTIGERVALESWRTVFWNVWIAFRSTPEI